MGRTLGSMQDRSAFPESAAVAEARELIEHHGHLPSAVRLRDVGHSRLSYLVEQAGGARLLRPDSAAVHLAQPASLSPPQGNGGVAVLATAMTAHSALMAGSGDHMSGAATPSV